MGLLNIKRTFVPLSALAALALISGSLFGAPQAAPPPFISPIVGDDMVGPLVKGERLGDFAVAGDDHKWCRADARIEGNTVVVSSQSGPNPKVARYAWQNNPPGVTDRNTVC